MVNCRFVKDGSFGSPEVISHDAVTSIAKSIDTRALTLPWKAKGRVYGEDKSAEKCFEWTGVATDYTSNQEDLAFSALKLP